MSRHPDQLKRPRAPHSVPEIKKTAPTLWDWQSGPLAKVCRADLELVWQWVTVWSVSARCADDCALVAHSRTNLQTLCSAFERACGLFGMEISVPKTEVVVSGPGRDANSPPLQIYGQDLNFVDNFKYLGSKVSADSTSRLDISTRIAAASSTFGRFTKKIFSRRELNVRTLLSSQCLSTAPPPGPHDSPTCARWTLLSSVISAGYLGCPIATASRNRKSSTEPELNRSRSCFAANA
jgi:hypothetical protein